MNKYQKELQKMRPEDEIQDYYLPNYTDGDSNKGYYKIETGGHGYLVVDKKDKNYKIAEKIVAYGYTGKHAIYLEEDCELSDFLKAI